MSIKGIVKAVKKTKLPTGKMPKGFNPIKGKDGLSKASPTGKTPLPKANPEK